MTIRAHLVKINDQEKIDKILVALDDSKNSQRALSMGVFLARQSDIKLIGINIIPNIPKNIII